MRLGLKPALASQLLVETMAGTAALLQAREYDTLTVRREVTSPGGSTARGLDALERGGVRGRLPGGDRPCLRGAQLMLLLATTRSDIANYVQALFEVYIGLIFIYILLNLLFSFGMRLPYARWSGALLNFLRDVSEPYLRVFRRFIPPLGAVRPVADDRDRRPLLRAVAPGQCHPGLSRSALGCPRTPLKGRGRRAESPLRGRSGSWPPSWSSTGSPSARW